MKAYALIVGIQSYNVKPLDNAVNDAEGMAQKMLSLGYIVDLQTDAKHCVRYRHLSWSVI